MVLNSCTAAPQGSPLASLAWAQALTRRHFAATDQPLNDGSSPPYQCVTSTPSRQSHREGGATDQAMQRACVVLGHLDRFVRVAR